MYDPRVGRWLTVDPSGFSASDANLYRYCGNRPTNATDPTGLQAVEVSDEIFEALAGINDEFKKKDKSRMVVAPAYNNKTLRWVTTENDPLTFKFVKGFIGTYRYRLARDDVKSLYVKLEVSVGTNKYDEIRLIQVVRLIRKEGGAIVPRQPSRFIQRLRADWGNKTALSPGWFVDANERNDVFWVPSIAANIGKTTTTLWDAPADFVNDKNVGKELITAVIGWKRGQAPVYLGAVRWGYYVDATGKVEPYPAEPQVYDTPPPEIGNSLAKWTKMLWTTLGKKIFPKLRQGDEWIDRIENIRIPPVPKD